MDFKNTEFVGGVAYIGGTFDLFHVGHVRLLAAAKQVFDRVIVSLNTDQFATRYKRIPVMNLEERIEIVGACRFVDGLVINHGNEDSRCAILGSHAQYIVHGSDWTGEGLMKQMGLTQEWLDNNGIQMYYLPYTPKVSTTSVIERLRDDTHL